MTSLLISLLPLIVVTAMMPGWIVMGLVLLRSPGGILKTAALAVGAMTARVLHGLLFGYVFDTAADRSGEEVVGIIASTLLLVIGLFLLITAVRKWFKEDDPDAPAPRWIAALTTASPLKTFGIGMLLMSLALKQWVFTFAALGLIDEAQVGRTNSVLAFLFFMVGAQSQLLAPVLASVVAPTRSAKLLDAIRDWLGRNMGAIAAGASALFGVYFLWKGIGGLISG